MMPNSQAALTGLSPASRAATRPSPRLKSPTHFHEEPDFKGRSYAADETRDLLRDVASLANAEGGSLILGMNEDGQARATMLRPVPNAERESDRIRKLCDTHISERVPGLRAPRIPVAGGDVIVLHVPRSYRRPHMVTLDHTTEFYIRHDRRNVQMTMAEIRTAFMSSAEITVKVERFIAERRARCSRYGRAMVLMATPLLLEPGRVDIHDPKTQALLRPTAPRPRPTLDGLTTGSDTWQLAIFRNGHLEEALLGHERYASRPGGDTWVFQNERIVERVHQFVKFVRKVRDELDLGDPFEIAVSVYGVAVISLSDEDEAGPRESRYRPPEGADLHLEPVTFPVDVDPDTIADEVLDLFWNGFGFMRAPRLKR